MNDWNMIVTALPGIRHQHRLLEGLHLLGEFHPCEFKDVCVGHVANSEEFLASIQQSINVNEEWTTDLGRVIPIEITFNFTPDSLAGKLKEAVTPFVTRIEGGTFYVRMERRGLPGTIISPEIEKAVAEHLFALAESQGKQLQTSFSDPDYIIAAETIGNRCGVVLITRNMRTRYPFVQTR